MTVAKFIGKTSCGFVSGEEYYIKTEVKGKYIWLYDCNSSASCPYESMETILDNWKILRHVKSKAK